MRKYQETDKERLVQVVCNGCGRQLKVENGYLKEGCFTADQTFGYFSNRDGVHHHFDLCEECYEKLLEQFSIPVEETEERELL